MGKCWKKTRVSQYFKICSLVCLGHFENTFLSPFNIYTALGMILSGSEMNTKTEIMKMMHLSTCLEHHTIHHGISGLLFNCAERGEGVEIMFGNGLFTAEDVDVKKDYENTLKSYYNAQTESVSLYLNLLIFCVGDISDGSGRCWKTNKPLGW